MNAKEQEHTETFITRTVREYIQNQEKGWVERIKVQRIWNWTFAIVAFTSILLCAVGIRFFIAQGKIWDEHITRETQLSEERAKREIVKFKMDSIMASEYIKEMKAYKKMPYYKEDVHVKRDRIVR
jgi:hypothetical protein